VPNGIVCRVAGIVYPGSEVLIEDIVTFGVLLLFFDRPLFRGPETAYCRHQVLLVLRHENGPARQRTCLGCGSLA
jgi:hypothetical protein